MQQEINGERGIVHADREFRSQGRNFHRTKDATSTSDAHGIRTAIIDKRVALSADHLTRIFNRGLSTRKASHRVGRHRGALGAEELDGALAVNSDGADTVATFTVNPLTPVGTKT